LTESAASRFVLLLFFLVRSTYATLAFGSSFQFPSAFLVLILLYFALLPSLVLLSFSSASYRTHLTLFDSFGHSLLVFYRSRLYLSSARLFYLLSMYNASLIEPLIHNDICRAKKEKRTKTKTRRVERVQFTAL